MVITVKRTKQVSQFEPITIEWSQETDMVDPKKATEEMLVGIDTQIDAYLLKNGIANGNWDAFSRILEKTSEMSPISIADFESLDSFQKVIVNNLKKAYKRSPAWKERTGSDKIENEQNRGK